MNKKIKIAKIKQLEAKACKKKNLNPAQPEFVYLSLM